MGGHGWSPNTRLDELGEDLERSSNNNEFIRRNLMQMQQLSLQNKDTIGQKAKKTT